MTAEQQQTTPDLTATGPSPDSTDAWATAWSTHLERLIADAALQSAPNRRWWQRELPWLVVRQFERHDHVLCAHRWERVAEWCAIRREGRHRTEVGVHYTARHRTEIRKTGAGGES